ncbi:hypothetical protein ACFU99_22730 [Streptomyces sp. NPDC057654]|uniref:hypothetical protein n=1 Tax=Streptomyces sp. NPDC057654 TaxID=3346196 RepID=UPI0036805C44
MRLFRELDDNRYSREIAYGHLPRATPDIETSTHTMGKVIAHLLRTYVTPIAGSLGAGLLLGLIGPVAGKGDNAVCSALSTIFSGGWPWGCFAFLVGYSCRSKTMSAILSFAGLAVGVVTYYGFKHISPNNPPGTHGTVGEGFSSGIVVWVVLAVILGVPMGLIGYLARRRDLLGLPFRLAVPLVAFFETNMRLRVEADGQATAVIVTWSVVQYASAVIALALIAYSIRTFQRSRRKRMSESDDVYRTMSSDRESI